MNSRCIIAALLLLSPWSEAGATDCDEDQSKASQVEQKLDLLERLLNDSEPLRRAQAEGNLNALSKIDEARESLAGARAALDGGCVAQASSLSSSGIKLATTAFRKSPKVSVEKSRDAYEAALQLSTSFLLALESHPEEVHGLSVEDLVGIERQIERAESVATNGDFTESVRLLAPVNDRLQRRLATILDNKTLYYEKNFATKADEYAYYKEQYDGILLLLKTEQKQAPYSARNRVDSLLARASVLSEEGERGAADQAWDDAISKIQEAVNHCEQALRATGYAY